MRFNRKILKKGILASVFCLILIGCQKKEKIETIEKVQQLPERSTYGYDKTFLQKHYKKTVVLESEDGKAGIVITPELQGRVMTSTLNGDEGMSFGWINYELIESGEVMKHINPTGGEERFWLGPEGGQYSIFFKPEVSFDFENWFVPPALDTETFDILDQNKESVLFGKRMQLVNYSGTKFDLLVEREIILLSPDQVSEYLGFSDLKVSSVAYETKNTLINKGQEAWKKETGLLSIWLLSMLNPSPEVTVVAPIKEGTVDKRGIRVNDNYFGKISKERLQSTETHVFYKADGQSRGKIGLSPLRATAFIGSYDAQNEVLTILQMNEPVDEDKFVNSAWELQEDPYSGDVLNSYNDGPLDDGTQMGPFYELESSSKALALKPDESYTHWQRIYHFKGKKKSLDQISQRILRISLEDIEKVF